MAIVWGPKASNGRDIRIGIDLSYSPTKLAYDTTSVTVTAKYYFKTAYSTRDTTNVLTYTGGTKNPGISWSSAKTGQELMVTKTYTVNTSTKSVKSTYTASLSGIDTAGGTLTASASITIPARPPGVGKPTVTRTITAGTGTATITTNRTNSSHTVTVKVDYGSKSTTLATKASITSVTWSPTAEAIGLEIPDKTSLTAKVTVTYFNGNTTIGSATANIKVNYPSNLVPTISNINHEGQYLATEDFDPQLAGSYLSSSSYVDVTFTDSGIHGSTIVSRQVTIGEYTSTSTETTVSSYPAFYSNGAVQPVVCTVVDSRGRTASSSFNINVIEYEKPRLVGVTIERCTSTKVPAADGTFIAVKGRAEVYKVPGRPNSNSAAVWFFAREVTQSIEEEEGLTWPEHDYFYDASYSLTTNIPALNFAGAKQFEPGTAYIIDMFISDQAFGFWRRFTISQAKFALSIGEEGIGAGKIHEFGAVDAEGDIYTSGALRIKDGSNWINGIDPVTGSNANGQYWKYPNGELVCRNRVELQAAANTRTTFTWNFPHNFSARPHVNVIAASTAPDIISLSVTGVGTSSTGVAYHRTTATSTTVDYEARGRWK